MSVTSVIKRFQESEFSERAGESIGVERYIVFCDSPSDGPNVAIAALPVTWGSTFPNTSNCYFEQARGVSFEKQDTAWAIEVRYSTLAPPTNGSVVSIADKYSWSGSGEDENVNYDLSGTKIVNTNGQPFDQPLTRPKPHRICTVNRVLPSSANIGLVLQYMCSTNSGYVMLDGLLFPAGKCFMADINIGPRKTTGGLQTRDCTFTVECRHPNELGFGGTPFKYNETQVGCFGLESLDGPASALVPITTPAGLTVSKGWPLDDAGKKKTNSTDDPYVKKFALIQAYDWSPLNFH